MPKTKRKKRSGNMRKRKGLVGRGGQNIPTVIADQEPRTCACPLHEGFWVTPNSVQIYAFPKCRKRAYDARKKDALRLFIFNGLRKWGTAVERAVEIAERAIQRFYTRYVKLIEELGYRYQSKTYQWIKA